MQEIMNWSEIFIIIINSIFKITLLFSEKVKKYKCDLCEKAFTSRDILKKHIRSHTAERPFLCSFCGKGFSSTYALKVHTRQHTNETPFTCDHCPAAFKQKCSLITHLSSKHKITTLEKQD